MDYINFIFKDLAESEKKYLLEGWRKIMSFSVKSLG